MPPWNRCSPRFPALARLLNETYHKEDVMRLAGMKKSPGSFQLVLELVLALLLLWGAIEAQGLSTDTCDARLSAVAADVMLDPQSILDPTTARTCTR
jgi:hypothetical protein